MTAKLPSLQVLRAVAAVMVLAHHAVMATNGLVAQVPQQLSHLLQVTEYRVEFFFVLSGYGLTHAFLIMPQHQRSLIRFLQFRFARLYLPFLPVSLALLLGYRLLPDLSESGGRRFSLLSSLLLLPDRYPPALGVAWTLVHEIQFILLFSLVFVSPIGAAALFGLWLVLIAANASLDYAASLPLIYLVNTVNLAFLIGVAAALVTHCVRQHSLRTLLSRPMTLLGGVCLAVIGAVMLLTSPVQVLVCLGFALVISAVFRYERRLAVAWPPLLVLIGNASYSIYLIHDPLLSLTQRAARFAGLTWFPALCFGILSSLAAGLLYWRFVEQPVTRWCRMKLLPTQALPTSKLPDSQRWMRDSWWKKR